MNTPTTTTLFTLAVLLACGTTHAQNAVRPSNIVISSKVVSIPADSAALRDLGLTLDSPEGLSNLGVVPMAKVTAMLAKIEKSPGVTLISAPSITTKAGTRAAGESSREMIYPTKFDTSSSGGGNAGKPALLAPGQIVTAVPSAPLQFQMRHIGVRIECEPTVNSDGSSIELTLAPELVTFEGFMNYGSPLKAAAAGQGGKLSEVVLSENQILQPVFAVFKTTTGVTIPSGHCLVLGGGGGLSDAAGAVPAGQKADGQQSVTGMTKPSNFVFFFIQAKIITP